MTTPVYQLTSSGTVIIRIADGACIPLAEGNSDYAAYKLWLEEGNIPTPVAPPSEEQVIASYEQAVQAHLDQQAVSKGYDGILSARVAAVIPGPFQAEGIAFATFWSNAWAKCYEVLAAVKAGTRTAPTKEELILEIPALVLA